MNKKILTDTEIAKYLVLYSLAWLITLEKIQPLTENQILILKMLEGAEEEISLEDRKRILESKITEGLAQ